MNQRARRHPDPQGRSALDGAELEIARTKLRIGGALRDALQRARKRAAQVYREVSRSSRSNLTRCAASSASTRR